MRRRHAWELLFLLALGTAQMVSDVLGWQDLKGLASATQMSPAMRVFTAHQGHETHAARFSVQWHSTDGQHQILQLTPGNYRNVRGPYNRRNVYGAALAYGPLLRNDPKLRPLQESVLQYAFCVPGPLRRELDIPADALDLQFQVRPVRDDTRSDLPLEWGVDCEQ
ncbi:MAG: hypothetical protein KDI48_17240 [Xanthomonadales bacterium]|nr:hypothetical protein [Xanthomonadales bacterium]